MVTEHQVRERAYYIWEDEGRCFGRADSHWFQAKAELHTNGADAPLSVQPVAADASTAPSPARSLARVSKTAKAAKPAASRAKPAPRGTVAARKAPRAASADATALH